MSSSNRPVNRQLIVLVVGIVVVAGAVAIFVSTPGSDTATGDVDVAGEELPPLPQSGDDPAVGQAAPVVSGEGLDQASLTVGEPDGEGQVVLFVTHWCPACQQEVPQVQQARDDGVLPDDVDLVAVSTSVQPGRDNHPPEEWLADEGWGVPTLLDDDGDTAFDAYTGGQGSYPFWAFLDADGAVVARHAGMLAPEDLASVMGQLAEL